MLMNFLIVDADWVHMQSLGGFHTNSQSFTTPVIPNQSTMPYYRREVHVFKWCPTKNAPRYQYLRHAAHLEWFAIVFLLWRTKYLSSKNHLLTKIPSKHHPWSVTCSLHSRSPWNGQQELYPTCLRETNLRLLLTWSETQLQVLWRAQRMSTLALSGSLKYSSGGNLTQLKVYQDLHESWQHATPASSTAYMVIAINSE